ncbi:MAG: NADH-quinone oxidoreductase subunit K [Elusimicrobia bacterium RIFCSPLOWO2_01_FULL_54_10]|nr:MAG: NADH-quinone oxidoreductase subunit K [Elusimicrobia bacterium RIFCSPLOWO2_01_FULL_54_10]
MGLQHYLALGSILFAIGIFGVLTRRNIIGILMSVELMFNAANINLVAFNRFVHGGDLWGQGFAIFVITLAAAEAVVGLALVLAIYRTMKTTYVEKMNLLKG